MTPRTCYFVIGFIISHTLALDESSGHPRRLLLQPGDSDNSSAVEQMINTTTPIPRDYVMLDNALHSVTSGPRKNTILETISSPEVAKAAQPTSSATDDVTVNQTAPSSADDAAGYQTTDSSTGDAKKAQLSPSATDNVTTDQTTPSTTEIADDADERRPTISRQEVTSPPPRSAEHDVLNRLLDPEVYDPSIRPGVDEGLSTRVEIDLIVNTVGPVNDRDMEFSISFILRQEWRDPRLTFTDFNRSLTISYMRQASLWVPDLYFIQAREETLHGADNPNVMIRLAPDGSVLYTQSCSVPGNWTCLKAVIVLKRELGYYIHQTYMPSLLIVMLSWASFWIDHEAVPARISVGLITVLTITTQSSGARAQLPRVPYVKAIDVWMLSCLLFVVAAYIECVLVIVLSRLHKKRNSPGIPKVFGEHASIWPYLTAETDVDNNRNVPISSGTETGTETGTGTSHKRDPVKRVDLVSRIAFPVLFIVFNVVYWLTFKLTV